uniref:Uncharacterized protein n=1 Tax=Oryza nivara TaxID=4536 RepID=A0A0E0FGM7_ORYNI
MELTGIWHEGVERKHKMAMNGSLLGCPRKSMPVVRLLRHRALLPPPPRGHQVFEGMCHRPTSQNDWNQTANMKPTVNPRPEKMNKRIMPSLSCQKLLHPGAPNVGSMIVI